MPDATIYLERWLGFNWFVTGWLVIAVAWLLRGDGSGPTFTLGLVLIGLAGSVMSVQGTLLVYHAHRRRRETQSIADAFNTEDDDDAV